MSDQARAVSVEKQLEVKEDEVFLNALVSLVDHKMTGPMGNHAPTFIATQATMAYLALKIITVSKQLVSSTSTPSLR